MVTTKHTAFKRSVGRPKSDPTILVTARLKKPEHAQLAAFAQKVDRSYSWLIRAALKDYITRAR